MTESTLPLLLEPEQLKDNLTTANVVIVDLCKAETYRDLHIPGAVHIEYGQIVAMRQPVAGLLPDADSLSRVLGEVGISPQSHVVAYDDEGGGKACRLLWTLEAAGHSGGYSLLNGGLHAWANEGFPLNREAVETAPASYPVTYADDCEAVIRYQEIRDHLGDSGYALLDARSTDEYTGNRVYASRGGHIPGAINIEWTQFMDMQRNLRLKSDDVLRTMLSGAGITEDRTVVAYCQTHHRSAHTWFVLKYLGYRARGYEGSWSDWGNRADSPIE